LTDNDAIFSDVDADDVDELKEEETDEADEEADEEIDKDWQASDE